MSAAPQEPLWFDSLEEAADLLSKRYPDGPKRLAFRLRPNKSPDAAHRWFLDCVNREREDRNFTPDDWRAMVKIGREIGCHYLMHFLCDDASYERPQPIEPETELTTLLREYVSSRRADGRKEQRIEVLLEKLQGEGRAAR